MGQFESLRLTSILDVYLSGQNLFLGCLRIRGVGEDSRFNLHSLFNRSRYGIALF